MRRLSDLQAGKFAIRQMVGNVDLRQSHYVLSRSEGPAARYDKSKIYPVVFVSHDGGGCENEWYSQGGIDNIMDNLIAAHKTQEVLHTNIWL